MGEYAAIHLSCLHGLGSEEGSLGRGQGEEWKRPGSALLPQPSPVDLRTAWVSHTFWAQEGNQENECFLADRSQASSPSNSPHPTVLLFSL